MKKTLSIFFFILIIVAVFAVGCDYTPLIEYENFIGDNDVTGRFEEYLSALSREESDWNFEYQVGRFREVFENFDTDDAEIEEINSLFLTSADNIMLGILALNDGDSSAYHQYNSNARGFFFHASDLWADYVEEERG